MDEFTSQDLNQFRAVAAKVAEGHADPYTEAGIEGMDALFICDNYEAIQAYLTEQGEL